MASDHAMMKKDCSCQSHHGPCWLHSDDLFRERNIVMLEQGNIRGFVVMERQRLREKTWHMQRAKIETIPEPLARPDLDDREWAAWERTPETRAAFRQIFGEVISA